MERTADAERQKKLMEEFNQDWSVNERRYKDKINGMNENIYKHGMQLNSYIHNEKEPYYLKNDHDFNKRLAELKALERDFMRNDPAKVQERLRMVSCSNIATGTK
jgi:hypothetical protein